MEAVTIIAMAVAIPVVLFPAAFIWYLNIGAALKARQAVRKTAPQAAK
jgi:hypothetical protein